MGMFLLFLFKYDFTNESLGRWIASAFWAGVDIKQFPALAAWEERMASRPAVQRGRDVPEPYRMKELQGNEEEMKSHAESAKSWGE